METAIKIAKCKVGMLVPLLLALYTVPTMLVYGCTILTTSGRPSNGDAITYAVIASSIYYAAIGMRIAAVKFGRTSIRWICLSLLVEVPHVAILTQLTKVPTQWQELYLFILGLGAMVAFIGWMVGDILKDLTIREIVEWIVGLTVLFGSGAVGAMIGTNVAGKSDTYGGLIGCGVGLVLVYVVHIMDECDRRAALYWCGIICAILIGIVVLVLLGSLITFSTAFIYNPWFWLFIIAVILASTQNNQNR